MHPAVIAFWLASPDPSQPEWEEQRQAVFASAWPASSGARSPPSPAAAATSAAHEARPPSPHRCASRSSRAAAYAVTGDKHFGSGLGITDRMMTTAIPEGESEPTIFVLDVRDRPWDGTAGLKLVAEWDGMGMAATQSHAMRLEGAPAVRLAWDGPARRRSLARRAPSSPPCSPRWSSACSTRRSPSHGSRSATRAERLRAYEQVEWARAEQDHWLAVQAYEGALRASRAAELGVAFTACCAAKRQSPSWPRRPCSRLTRVLGGGTFSQRSPFAHWFEDVRALGFLRPPWGLAYDTLFATSLE